VTRPDESRRVTHPSGFSIVHPRHWSGLTYGAAVIASDENRTLRFAPDVPVGRQPTLEVRMTPAPAEPIGPAEPITFQDRPAIASTGYAKRMWQYRIVFEREGRHFYIDLRSPVKSDAASPLWRAYFESFRYATPTSRPVLIDLVEPDAPGTSGTRPSDPAGTR
jgi:hypothetical protein